MTHTITPESRAGWRDPALGTRRELSLPQGALTVFDTGSGDPLVFVHGLLVNANLWRKVIPALAGEFRCVAIDLPFGSHTTAMPAADLSAPGLAQLVIQAVEQLDLGPVTLVGNDSGGAVSQLVVAARPDLVARLVLTSCDAYENFPPPFFDYLGLAARTPGALACLALSMRIRPVRRLPIAYGRLAHGPIERAVSDSYALPVSAKAIREDVRRAIGGLDSRYTLTAAKTFADFEQPVLLAWSAGDRFFPDRYAERLAAEFPDARIEWIRDSYTFSPEDQPAQLTSAIRVFLDATRADTRQ
ncbi:alpha/beta fold hydrolase [Nocardia aurantiaca]|uniref:Alpha/beta fold hydrolase n=1 Tax=Nocardia aurantiaca TaxID=2675850 RepID=A0A6I3KYK3_9NOCA|nr:alpha/beta hydrolase [Nocardia aurantiaca]MTE13284.1 alpha/beta fold hydrolase [Nocardia aurantiaca]